MIKIFVKILSWIKVLKRLSIVLLVGENSHNFKIINFNLKFFHLIQSHKLTIKLIRLRIKIILMNNKYQLVKLNINFKEIIINKVIKVLKVIKIHSFSNRLFKALSKKVQIFIKVKIKCLKIVKDLN